jgi:hypothetical protein
LSASEPLDSGVLLAGLCELASAEYELYRWASACACCDCRGPVPPPFWVNGPVCGRSTISGERGPLLRWLRERRGPVFRWVRGPVPPGDITPAQLRGPVFRWVRGPVCPSGPVCPNGPDCGRGPDWPRGPEDVRPSTRGPLWRNGPDWGGATEPANGDGSARSARSWAIGSEDVASCASCCNGPVCCSNERSRPLSVILGTSAPMKGVCIAASPVLAASATVVTPARGPDLDRSTPIPWPPSNMNDSNSISSALKRPVGVSASAESVS